MSLFVTYYTDENEEKLHQKKKMRGVGGPLLTIGDLLSDLAVDGGDDPLVGVGDASAPSSPSATQQAGKADPSDLSRLFEVRARFLPSTQCSLDRGSNIDSSIVGYSSTSGIVELTAQLGVEHRIHVFFFPVTLRTQLLPYGAMVGEQQQPPLRQVRACCWQSGIRAWCT
jgi:hypothetical protein